MSLYPGKKQITNSSNRRYSKIISQRERKNNRDATLQLVRYKASPNSEIIDLLSRILPRSITYIILGYSECWACKSVSCNSECYTAKYHIKKYKDNMMGLLYSTFHKSCTDCYDCENNNEIVDHSIYIVDDIFEYHDISSNWRNSFMKLYIVINSIKTLYKPFAIYNGMKEIKTGLNKIIINNKEKKDILSALEILGDNIFIITSLNNYNDEMYNILVLLQSLIVSNSNIRDISHAYDVCNNYDNKNPDNCLIGSTGILEIVHNLFYDNRKINPIHIYVEIIRLIVLYIESEFVNIYPQAYLININKIINENQVPVEISNNLVDDMKEINAVVYDFDYKNRSHS